MSCAKKAQLLALLIPIQRKRLKQIRQSKIFGLPPFKDGFNNVWCQQTQSYNSAGVGLVCLQPS